MDREGAVGNSPGHRNLSSRLTDVYALFGIQEPFVQSRASSVKDTAAHKNIAKYNFFLLKRLSKWGRCYDHNFLRFSPIFGEKRSCFSCSKSNVMIKFYHNLALFSVKNANFFADFVGENILKIITLVPGHTRRKRVARMK
jgi:hypothetical protein